MNSNQQPPQGQNPQDPRNPAGPGAPGPAPVPQPPVSPQTGAPRPAPEQGGPLDEPGAAQPGPQQPVPTEPLPGYTGVAHPEGAAAEEPVWAYGSGSEGAEGRAASPSSVPPLPPQEPQGRWVQNSWPSPSPARPVTKAGGWRGIPAVGKGLILGGAALVLILASGGGGFALGRVSAPGLGGQFGQQSGQGSRFQGPGQYQGDGGSQGYGPGTRQNGQGGMSGPGNLSRLTAAVHGEYIAQIDGKYVTLLEQRGEVTAVSSTRITVKSADGFEQSYTINDQTSVRAGDSLATGQTVQVTALKDGLVAQTILEARVSG